METNVIDFENLHLSPINPLVKPKRKYTKKPKKVIDPPPLVPESKGTITKGFLHKTVDLFIYHEGSASTDLMLYIKHFQLITEAKGLRSQVQIVTGMGLETCGINTLFWCQTPMKDWTDFRLRGSSCLCINIKELPNFSPEELYTKAEKLESNPMVEFKEII